MRWIPGLCCLLLALFFLVQLLGLLLVQRIAVNAAEENSEVQIPLSVRYVGMIADRLHREVLNEPLNPDGSNWPKAFRWFFVLQLCGLAGICVAFAQLGAGLIRRQTSWLLQARTVLVASCLALVIGIGFLKLIRSKREIPTPAPQFDELSFVFGDSSGAEVQEKEPK